MHADLIKNELSVLAKASPDIQRYVILAIIRNINNSNKYIADVSLSLSALMPLSSCAIALGHFDLAKKLFDLMPHQFEETKYRIVTAIGHARFATSVEAGIACHRSLFNLTFTQDLQFVLDALSLFCPAQFMNLYKDTAFNSPLGMLSGYVTKKQFNDINNGKVDVFSMMERSRNGGIDMQDDTKYAVA